jgi:hypothetical protein
LEGRMQLEFTGEDTAEEEGVPRPSGVEHLRAAPPTNLDQVKEYFETLIRLHPWRKWLPDAVSALDFYPAMFGYEMASIYGVHRAGIDRAEAEVELWDVHDGGIDIDTKPMMDDNGAILEGEEDSFRGGDAREERLRRELERLRREALGKMKELGDRMDTVMEAPPYATDHEMLRLRAMVALYMADLLLPPSPRSADEEELGKAARSDGREHARRLFVKIVENGGDLEEQWVKDFVRGPDFEDEEEEEEGEERHDVPVFSLMPVFSSLPIR